ncbi:hypothetical protein [Colwellia ponticola]|uniref:hypothetical protein n=1 Tax=Colwellia ponticola TaxID=2304625 RepID=UPI0035289E8C
MWAGIGAIGVTILSMFLFDESKDLLNILCLLLIVSGTVGVELVSALTTSS